MIVRQEAPIVTMSYRSDGRVYLTNNAPTTIHWHRTWQMDGKSGTYAGSVGARAESAEITNQASDAASHVVELYYWAQTVPDGLEDKPCNSPEWRRVEAEVLAIPAGRGADISISWNPPRRVRSGSTADLAVCTFRDGSRRDLEPPLDHAFQGRAKLVVPWRSGNGYTGLVLYEPVRGMAAFYECDGSGRLHEKKKLFGFSRWTHVVPGRFTDLSTRGDHLVFYDAATGRLAAGALDDSGTWVDRWRSTIAPGWTHVLPGDFHGGGPCTDIMFYRWSDGQLHLRGVDGRTGLAGGGLAGNFPSASIILPGRFIAGSAWTDLLLFSRRNGEWHVYSCDGSHGLAEKKSGHWGTLSWRHAVAGAFTQPALSDLLFIDDGGGAQLYRSNGDGDIALVGSPGVPLTSHAVPGRFDDSGYEGVAFYETLEPPVISGHAATGDTMQPGDVLPGQPPRRAGRRQRRPLPPRWQGCLVGDRAEHAPPLTVARRTWRPDAHAKKLAPSTC
jgi:hypothetical protein